MSHQKHVLPPTYQVISLLFFWEGAKEWSGIGGSLEPQDPQFPKDFPWFFWKIMEDWNLKQGLKMVWFRRCLESQPLRNRAMLIAKGISQVPPKSEGISNPKRQEPES